MKKLIEVEQARAIMTEAIDWSVMKWLSEKKRVRKAADKANEVLNATELLAQQSWSDELRSAYAKSGASNPEIERLARKLRNLHDTAYRLHMEAEEIFDRAEKRLSTALAREGCAKAIEGWDTHLESIRQAEAAIPMSTRRLS